MPNKRSKSKMSSKSEKQQQQKGKGKGGTQQKQQRKKRGKRVEMKMKPSSAAEKCASSNNNRWNHKELEHLSLALRLAVNPKSESDWRIIADAVSKGCLRKKTGDECRARAEKDGLVVPSLVSSSSTTMVATSSSFDDDLFDTYQKPRRLPAAKSKRSFSAPDAMSSSAFDEIHTKHYDEFFAKQESPLNEPLDLDDSLVRDCFVPPTTYTRLKRTRNHPFIIRALSGESDSDVTTG